MTNTVQETLKKLEKIYDCKLMINTSKDVFPYDYVLYVEIKKNDKARYITIKLNKNFSEDWLRQKIERIQNNPTKNFKVTFKKLKIKGNIYYTSFGFSYDMFFKSKEQFEKDIQKIKDYLTSKKIVFRNEFSDAFWVYRFVISQSTKNLNKITNLQ